jgi:hypothetical protein
MSGQYAPEERRDEGDHVPLEAVRQLLDHILGGPVADWRIERWGDEFEGWSAGLRTWCFKSDDACGDGMARSCECCDPKSLTADDVALIEAATTARDAAEEKR